MNTINRLFLTIPLFFFFAVLVMCNQDPIFNMVANEVEPKDPLINGSPSKIVEFGGAAYVANGNLWSFSGTSWSKVSGAPDNARAVSTDGTNLYVLSIDGSTTTVYAKSASGGFSSRGNAGYFIQSIYEGYAGALKGNSYAILKLDPRLSLFQTISSPLTGVARKGATDYFATASHGIYYKDGAGSFTRLPGTTGYSSIAGIINANGTIIAVSGKEYILFVKDDNSGVIAQQESTWFTGALALWKRLDSTAPDLLLVGIRTSIYELGYREIRLSDRKFGTPGDTFIPNSSIKNKDEYTSSLARNAVTTFYITDKNGGNDDNHPLIFASTEKDGLWSYRKNEWNAEE